MEKLAQDLVDIAINTAKKEALEGRCLKALSKLSSLRLSNEFLASSCVENLFSSFESIPHLKPAIKESVDRLLTLWLRQLLSRPTTKKPQPNPGTAEKPQIKNKTLQNPNPNAESLGYNKSKESSAEELALELVDVAIETATTVNQPLDDRCIKALSTLSMLNLGSEFIVSSDIANMVDYSLYSNCRLKPLIRGHAARLLALWTAQIPPDKKAKNLKPTSFTGKHKVAACFKKPSNKGKEAVC